MATLYIIATPIGNLEDITLRAIRILKGVDLILCEDTRVTKRLLDKYEIKTPTLSYHAQSKLSKVEKIFALLEEGNDLALVSDAGTPTISDPGCLLVAQVREKFGDAVAVVPVPGPSAVLSALSVSGFPTSEFLFLGFLPHKKGRETLFKEISGAKRTVAFYESPHRVLKTLESLKKHLHPKRRILVARELTKIYEESIIGEPEEVLAYYLSHPDRVRGEFVVVVDGA
ncbi:MAG: 16S rRNA (cytidine(1402)-2'-O)-methyltransferase [Candidatus Lloydbacteria bacterium RIFCSPHIGHO2_02_FULL_54_17]|uniref:Ribosomal RNA small subunit methyltransferase I n=1 Tax=Candidatus Lloydbacteria bacterium RIFCSPHIGHO2_02_FULL_54_17 TaxID=1798664 RepID=A0A1G2DHJ6_9BACT|nr:MAG: 16S rRNA (cytidine(1402)-2'-O)-methyltransferase [Candidatus Lloydbacteria bacterium RIFCSPHIGHO2_01_FULL_54_11]OGZ12340.1 MAG: 16S rRNA (cytidine(1402)-2'-O)-methyltransferase [Candidatus Lloydbacteria bacterium RIFCSPHIGHO2_02_FULL_54_17]OGZ14489.1 MAG: 16S rRNA (cytidine(1402)-2'-O)-methyltransferase [Candidatus Lloydbacteria bacterium RIFCSPLOWO2_02_FULL_54_12]OGZ14567.1 MAG: 16S rRNA (cytidine(1402)-2'-O)-methyltransferase [Candidatus Lloydbacteria bacterium RIFCSPLOWO2_01_FULL_54_1